MDAHEHFEIERKYLIRYPDSAFLSRAAEDTEITQTYLKARQGQTARVRKRGKNGNYQYTHTVKQRVSDLRRIENEREITEAEYLELLQDRDPQRNTISKTRWCLPYLGQLFEIDVFPFWKKQAVMEIELTEEGQAIQFPPEIQILREVTDDPAYTNSALALSIPDED